MKTLWGDYYINMKAKKIMKVDQVVWSLLLLIVGHRKLELCQLSRSRSALVYAGEFMEGLMWHRIVNST